MMRKTRAAGTLALGATVALLAAGCSGGSDGGSGDGDVSMTFWHNSTTGPGKAYWEDTVADFEAANPGVTIKVQSIQNEDMDGKLQTALNSGDAPDIFMHAAAASWPTSSRPARSWTSPTRSTRPRRPAVGAGASTPFTVDGKVYGMPTAVLPGGIYYSKDLFDEGRDHRHPDDHRRAERRRGRSSRPPTSPRSRSAPRTPGPPRTGTTSSRCASARRRPSRPPPSRASFDDPCWLAAGEDLQAFSETEPFNEGFLTTSAQQGAGSSAGLIANHKAAHGAHGRLGPGRDRRPDPGQEAAARPRLVPVPRRRRRRG